MQASLVLGDAVLESLVLVVALALDDAVLESLVLVSTRHVPAVAFSSSSTRHATASGAFANLSNT
jgi:hypothetical protein